MRLIKEFSDFEPNNDLIRNYIDIINNKYEIINDKTSGYKLVLIDDRIYYLNGPYGFKTRLVNRIFFDLNEGGSFHEASLRKAIKDWINSNSN